MKTEHTPEPWKSIEEQFHGEVMNFIGDKDGGTIGEIYTENDARRIVACVNACKGIPTDVLEHAENFGAAGIKTVESLREQRDELLAALAIAAPVMDAHAGPSRLADFRAAIASVKEK